MGDDKVVSIEQARKTREGRPLTDEEAAAESESANLVSQMEAIDALYEGFSKVLSSIKEGHAYYTVQWISTAKLEMVTSHLRQFQDHLFARCFGADEELNGVAQKADIDRLRAELPDLIADAVGDVIADFEIVSGQH
jgi:hypothetical protein